MFGRTPIGDMNAEEASIEMEERRSAMLDNYTVAELKQLLRDRGNRVGGRKSQLVERLLVEENFDPWVDGTIGTSVDTESIDDILHRSWFMSPVSKGDINAFRKGSLNEARIPMYIDEFFREHGIRKSLLQMRDVGLVCDKELPYLATSVDGIGVLTDLPPIDSSRILDPNSETDDESSSGFQHVPTTYIWENKTRPGKKSKEKIKKIAERHGRLINLNLENLDDRRTLKQVMPNAIYRSQVLHHAATCNWQNAAYVESTLSGVEYIVLLQIPMWMLQDYRWAMQQIVGSRVELFHDDAKLPGNKLDPIRSHFRQNISQTLQEGWITDIDTYVLNFAIWKRLETLSRDTGKIYGSIKSILPAIVNAWNKLKGGVDVYSRLIAIAATFNEFDSAFFLHFDLASSHHLACKESFRFSACWVDVQAALSDVRSIQEEAE